MKDGFVIGIDFGTDSVRSVLVDSKDGSEVSSSVFAYPRWRDGLFCSPSENRFRQHPLDYIEGLTSSVRDCLKAAPECGKLVRAISVDTTGSTPVAVDRKGIPLSMLPGFEMNPNAMFVLWKDHTSTKEAAEINHHAGKFRPNFLKYVGGIYSSEWFWAKLLHVLRTDERVLSACYSWVEHCDWIPFLLTGGNDVNQLKRGVCSAGHKALWAKEFGGLPVENFFASLDKRLKGFRERLFNDTYTADQSAGRLSEEWASRLGLPTEVLVGIGAFDAHMGAVGGQIEPYHLSKVMGTSTCDMLVAPRDEMEGKLVRGICGQVDGSIIPGMIGLEAGQSAFGDTYAWFRNVLAWPITNLLKEAKDSEALADAIVPELSRQAQMIALKESDPVALDWLNGRRTPDADQELKAAIMGLNLATDAPAIFKTLVESTCFGARAIVDRFVEEGIPVKGLIGLGGVARKSPYVMQVMADVMNMPIRIHKSDQTCAAGAAMFAATVAGNYSCVEEAMHSMGRGFEKAYTPDPGRRELYARRYAKYLDLGKATESISR